ncbi:MAG: MotA/TolQ/ExbB proton channel family protein [Pseudomonadota bacterium]
MNEALQALQQLYDLGGPVILLLKVLSIFVVGTVIYKAIQFKVAGVGRHRALNDAVKAWDAGDRNAASTHLSKSKSYLAPVIDMAFASERDDNDRLVAEAEALFIKLERGLRPVENIAQLAPLLGLFGTVLGMIQAFQALQDAGSQVDPSILAGGIWVALLTTAAGLAVAMPTSVFHSWLEARMQEERGIADRAIQTILRPRDASALRTSTAGTRAHA